MTAGNGFRLLEHTADMGIEARAASCRELLEAMAKGLVALIFGDSPVRAMINTKLEVHAEDRVELLVAWLNEIVYWSESNNIVPATFQIEAAGDDELLATVSGEPFDPERHSLEHQVKSVTYHQVCLEETADGWYGRVYVDL
ncbi:MAG: archease [Desulfuromonadales bacterium]|nr:archease [Desulfuromonadales bacterium]